MSGALAEVAGTVDAPSDTVAHALRDAVVATLRERGHDGARVEGTGNVLIVQGGWWYRGEYEYVPLSSTRTRVTHRVYNVATRLRWGVPLANRLFIGLHASTKHAFAGLLERMANDIGCVAAVESDVTRR